MLFAALGDTSYNVVLLLHILTAIVGFGAVFLNALYGRAAERRRGAEGLAIAEANYDVSHMATYFIYAVPVFGSSWCHERRVLHVQQGWITVSFVLYIIGIGLSHGVLRPNVKRVHGSCVSWWPWARPPAGPTQAGAVDEIERRARTVGIVGAVLNLLLIVLLYLMVWQPGQ